MAAHCRQCWLDLPLTRSMLPSLGTATCTDDTRKCHRCTQNQGISRRSVPRLVPRRRRRRGRLWKPAHGWCLLFAAPATGGGEGRSGLPRVCGANLRPEPEAGPAVGLPPVCPGGQKTACSSGSTRGLLPRVRGGLPVGVPVLVVSGLPPRVRGGRCDGTLPSYQSGLPPRVRGGPEPDLLRPVPQRATPACAGRTLRRRRGGSGRADYPRVCGADRRHQITASFISGLPPRVRGGRWWSSARQSPLRTTPACAGRTG